MVSAEIEVQAEAESLLGMYVIQDAILLIDELVNARKCYPSLLAICKPLGRSQISKHMKFDSVSTTFRYFNEKQSSVTH